MKFAVFLAFLGSVLSQVCNRIPPLNVVDMDNLGLAQAGCSISNIIKPYSAASLPWNPSSVPSRGYYKISMTFKEAMPLTSCDLWASTDGSHNPTGVKFYDRPAGTLLAATTSFNTKMTRNTYNFLMIPEMNVSSIYIEVYKSTTWQLWLDTISCNTCYMPSDTPTVSFTRTPSPSASPVSVTQTLTPSWSFSTSPSKSRSHTVSDTAVGSPSKLSTPAPSKTSSPTETPSPTETQTTINLNILYTPSDMSTFSPTPDPFVNATIAAAAASSAPDLVALSSVAVGLGGVSVLAILSSFIAKQFAPDASGNRPSLSQVASNMFTLAKKKAVDMAKDIEADVKEKIEIVKKDPKLLLKAVSNPKEALSFAKASVTKAVKNNLPVSQPPVSQPPVLVAVEDFPGHIAEEQVTVDAVAPVVDVPSISGSSLTTIQVNEEDLEAVQKMLKLLNKPHTVVAENVSTTQ